VTYIASSTLVTLDTTSVQVAAANPKRVAILIQVKSGGVVSLKFGGGITVDVNGINDGIDVPAFLLLDIVCPTDNIHMIASVPNTIALVQEVLNV
jgi:hypothetical protein